MSTQNHKLPVENIRAIVFDKDGTLFEFDSAWITYCHTMFDQLVGSDWQARGQLANACGFDLENNSFLPGSVIVGGSIDELCNLWSDILVSTTPDEILEMSYQAVAGLNPDPVCDLSVLTSTLSHHDLVLGVVTNDLERAARDQLQKQGVQERFAVIIGSDSGYRPKPEPDTLLAFCKQTNIDPAEVAMVGDSTHDLKAARNSGVGMAIGVLTGPADADALSPYADIILPDISILPKFLRP